MHTPKLGIIAQRAHTLLLILLMQKEECFMVKLFRDGLFRVLRTLD